MWKSLLTSAVQFDEHHRTAAVYMHTHRANISVRALLRKYQNFDRNFEDNFSYRHHYELFTWSATSETSFADPFTEKKLSEVGAAKIDHAQRHLKF